SYFLTRYDDVVTVYADHHAWSSDKRVEFAPKFGASPLYEHHTTSVVFRDPPDHTRIRRLFAPAFTPKALAALEPRVVRFVDGLLDGAAGRGGRGGCPALPAGGRRPPRSPRRGVPGAGGGRPGGRGGQRGLPPRGRRRRRAP